MLNKLTKFQKCVFINRCGKTQHFEAYKFCVGIRVCTSLNFAVHFIELNDHLLYDPSEVSDP